MPSCDGFYFGPDVLQVFGGLTVGTLNLIVALHVLGKSQADVALAVGISESQFSRMLRGRVHMPPHIQSRIGEALGIDHNWLFALGERPAIPPHARREMAVSSRPLLEVR
jgi:transcriptional regulator with XRE-family HTH domain